MNKNFDIHDPSFKESLKEQFTKSPEGYFEEQKNELLNLLPAQKKRSIVPMFLKFGGAIAAVLVVVFLLRETFNSTESVIAENTSLSVEDVESIWLEEAESFETPLLALYDTEEDYEKIFIDDETRASDIEDLFVEEWDDEYDY